MESPFATISLASSASTIRPKVSAFSMVTPSTTISSISRYMFFFIFNSLATSLLIMASPFYHIPAELPGAYVSCLLEHPPLQQEKQHLRLYCVCAHLRFQVLTLSQNQGL